MMKLPKKIPKVSVCVVTYNQEKYIHQCLKSILEQEADFDFEVIVGDDCSIDSTVEIINSFLLLYPENLRLIRREKNIGPFENLINTCREARYEYIAHCDGDDFWLPNKLQMQVSLLEKNKEVSGVFTNAKMGFDLINSKKNIELDISDALKTIFTRSPFVRSSLVERRKNFNLIFNYYSPGFPIYDFEMYWLAHQYSRLFVIGEPYVDYNNQSNGIGKDLRILDYYYDAIIRLRCNGLPMDVFSSMFLDYRVVRYFKFPSSENKIGFFECFKSSQISFFTMLKVSLPVFLLKFIYRIRRFVL